MSALPCSVCADELFNDLGFHDREADQAEDFYVESLCEKYRAQYISDAFSIKDYEDEALSLLLMVDQLHAPESRHVALKIDTQISADLKEWVKNTKSDELEFMRASDL